MFKALTFATGAALLAVTAHASVVIGPGYGSPQGFIILAIAAGVAVGAVAIGIALSEKRRVLVCGLGLALLAGEGFTLLATAERVMLAREAQQAPLRAAAAARDTIASRIAGITIPETTPRLAAAITAQHQIAADVAAKAALRGCARNCRKLLESETERAAKEVAVARQALATTRQRAQEHIQRARRELAALPAAVSHSPLADRLGVAPWLLDVITAGLASFAANGLGCLLLAFASHRPTQAHAVAREALVDPAPRAVLDQVDAFAADSIKWHARRCFRLTDAHQAYRMWCANKGCVPAEPGDFADAFASLVKEADLSVERDDAELVIRGAMLRPVVDVPALPAPA